MSNNTLRIRFLSFNDAANQPFVNVLFYIKKLVQVPASSGSPIELQEKDPKLSIVLSLKETIDLLSDDEYIQILFIESKTNVIGDLILNRNYLIEHVMDVTPNEDVPSEVVCSAPLERKNYKLEFSLQLINDNTKDHGIHRVKKRYQQIRGHLMLIKQFTKPVYCAICNRFIWGILSQGYECSQCSLVTHKICHQQIPFWCQKCPHPERNISTGNARFEFHIPHIFKQYETSYVRNLVSRDHSYCNHCGSQVLQNILKCTKCQFIIHKQCESNVPPMCTISYKSVAHALDQGVLQIVEPDTSSGIPDSEISRIENENNSIGSSLEWTWLEPLPTTELTSLPKFSDFECIGCLGDGRYANVYCVQHVKTKEYFAVKVIDGLNGEARRHFEIERQILFRYSPQNPYMIKPYFTFHQGSKLFFAMEFVDGDLLNQKIQKKRMNESEIRSYLVEIISVLQYLHSNNIVYRDLKLEHIIINSEGHIRLVDYGLGRMLQTSDELCHTICGTNGYMAPELVRSQDGYSFPVDYWALGIVFLQMLCGEQLQIHDENINETYIAENLQQLSRGISPEARSCLTGLLDVDPKKRLGSPNSPYGSIRDHIFFKIKPKIDWKEIDDGLFISMYKKPSIMPNNSDIVSGSSLSTLLIDRGTRIKAEWIANGESTCTPAEEEQFKLYDYINQFI